MYEEGGEVLLLVLSRVGLMVLGGGCGGAFTYTPWNTHIYIHTCGVLEGARDTEREREAPRVLERARLTARLLLAASWLSTSIPTGPSSSVVGILVVLGEGMSGC